MWQPEAFLDPQNAPKSLAAGELTALPQTPYLDSRGPTSKGKGGEGRGGEGLPRLEITSGYALATNIQPFFLGPCAIFPSNFVKIGFVVFAHK